MAPRGESLKATLLEKAQNGFHPASLPIGYYPCELVTIPNRELAPIIRGAIERAADGETLSQIRSWLIEQDFRTKHGKVPRLDAVSEMVTNPLYAGFIAFNGQLYPGRHQPIVPMGLVIEAVKQLESRRRGTSANNANPSARYRLIATQKHL